MFVTMAGVQSAPRVMRGPPVTRPMMWDVPLEMRTFELGDAMSPPLVQVPTTTTPSPMPSSNTPLIVGGLAVAALFLLRGKR